jgi:YD repeat-containing protein
MLSVTYPNGQAYSYGYDTMGRPSAMTDQGTQQPVISNVSYGPAGELLSLTGVVNETRSYNTRLQLTALNNVSYVYAAANNGKIQSQTDSVSGEQITYGYDALNRLISGVTSDNPNVTQWGQGFTYDGFGNLTDKSVTKGSAPYLSVGVDATTNRIVGYLYNANGNQTWSGTQTLSYDYDNRMVKVDNRNSTGSQYGYDPENKRVYTADWTYDYNTSTTTVANEIVYFFGVTGQRMTAYGLVAYASPPTVTLTRANDRVYFGGKLNPRGFGAVGGSGPIGVGGYVLPLR